MYSYYLSADFPRGTRGHQPSSNNGRPVEVEGGHGPDISVIPLPNSRNVEPQIRYEWTLGGYTQCSHSCAGGESVDICCLHHDSLAWGPGQTRKRVVWELSDQIWMRILFNYYARGQTRMRIVWELNKQIWMKVLFNSYVHGKTRARVVWELNDNIWMRILFSFYACGQMRMRGVW